MPVRAVLLDWGDTLADQESEERDEDGLLIGAELFPGARALLDGLAERGLPVALVVDGDPDENRIVRVRHGLADRFAAVAISDTIGAEKPDPAPYRAALEALGVPEQAHGEVVMLGNRLDRDVRGARRLGLVAVWLDKTPRYSKEPELPEDRPDATIHEPGELLDVIDRLQAGAAA